MYITPDMNIARAAEAAGVDWIFVDLETLGKQERQGHLDTVMSRHTIADVMAVKSVLTTSKLLVRVNPINTYSASEIDEVIRAGADIVMLPFFSTADEAAQFISMVGRRAETCLLVETPAAVENLVDIIQIPGINYIHLGLNDLHLGYGMNFMFEPLTNGMVDRIAAILRKANIEFGFGGIACLGQGKLLAEQILGEHRRLGSTIVILSRSFLNVATENKHFDARKHLLKEVKKIREYEVFLNSQSDEFFMENQRTTISAVSDILGGLSG